MDVVTGILVVIGAIVVFVPLYLLGAYNVAKDEAKREAERQRPLKAEIARLQERLQKLEGQIADENGGSADDSDPERDDN